MIIKKSQLFRVANQPQYTDFLIRRITPIYLEIYMFFNYHFV